MNERFHPVVMENSNRSDRIVTQLKTLMYEGEIKPGDKLPPERELAELMNVSRTSVREAIKTLSAMGLVVIKKGHGVFVSEANLGFMVNKMGENLILKKDEIDQLFELRKVLETQAAEWAAERAGDEELQTLKSIVDEAKAACHNPDINPEAVTDYDTRFHNSVINASHNNVLGMVMGGMLEVLAKVRMRTMRVPGRVAQSILDHEEIVKAIMSRDGKSARRAMYKHIESVEESIKNSEED